MSKCPTVSLKNFIPKQGAGNSNSEKLFVENILDTSVNVHFFVFFQA